MAMQSVLLNKICNCMKLTVNPGIVLAPAQDVSHASLMRSISPERVSFQQPEPMDESSVLDQEMLEVSVQPEGVKTYEVVPASSQRQRDKLIDSDGFTYNVKSKRGATTYFYCS